MVDLLQSLNLSALQWLLAALCGLVIGASKTGLTGIAFLAFPILAAIFGTRVSTGVALPMLLLADLFAVVYYRRHTHWRHLLKLMPWTLAGIFIALLAGKQVSDKTFGVLFALTLLAGIGIMVWRELRRQVLTVPDKSWFAVVMGLFAGFATMIGNAAGPMTSLYLLAMRLPKAAFIGTGAWFYLAVNVTKVPLHLFVWGTISPRTLVFNAAVAPFILAGLAGGIFIVKRLPEKVYRILVMGTVTMAALMLVVKLM